MYFAKPLCLVNFLKLTTQRIFLFIIFLISALSGINAACQTLPAEELPPYRFGVPPWQKDMSGDDIRRFFRPMLDELSEKLGRRIVLVGASDYAEITEMLIDGRIDMATISPAPYLIAKQKKPSLTMILTELSWNSDHTAKSDFYRSYIIALKSRDDLNRVEDLKGQKFGFVAKESTSGFIVPKNMLAQHGIDWEKDFGKIYFLGSHPKVTDALLAGSLDACATWDFNLSQVHTKYGDAVKILAQSEQIPNLGIVVSSSISNAQRKIIQHTLTNIEPEKLKGMSAAGYVMRSPEIYDKLVKLLK
jgi:phosphonate transport system substrate-binding protein